VVVEDVLSVNRRGEFNFLMTTVYILHKNFRYVCYADMAVCGHIYTADLAVSSPELRNPFSPPTRRMPYSFSFAYNINIRDQPHGMFTVIHTVGQPSVANGSCICCQ